MTYLLFYKAPGTLWDRVIRFVTNSKYSHVEIAFEKQGDSYRCWSSASRDNTGVRMQWISNKMGSWDVLELNGNYSEQLFIQQNGKGYDYIGLLCTVLRTDIFNSKSKWFCSEIIAESFGIYNSCKYTPQDLYEIYA